MAASETLTVALEGPDIPLSSFATAVSALDALLKALAAEVATESALAWDIDSLEASSAIATVRGSITSGDPDGVARVSAAYEVIGDALCRQAEVPYSQKVMADHVAAIRLETPSDTFKQIGDYSHPPRRWALKSSSDIAELSVGGAIANIVAVAVRADVHTQTASGKYGSAKAKRGSHY